MATLGSTKAIEALYGRAVAIDTTAGFVVWRYGWFIGVVAGVWALLAVTRLLRGEEDAARTELLLASPLPRRRLLVGQMSAAGAGSLLMGLAVFVGALVARLPAGGSAVFGSTAALETAVFAALAAVSSQLFGERRRAAGWTGGLVAAAYLVRAAGDGSSAGWLVWLSPLGWAERVTPFHHPEPLGLVLLAVATGGLVGLALVLAARRDVGLGLLTRTTRPRAPVRPLTGAVALDWRLNRGRFVAWAGGAGAYGLLVGFLAKSLTDYFKTDQGFGQVTSKLAGGASMGSADGLLALVFGFLALVLALYAGYQLVSGRGEEAQGRLDGLVVTPLSRTRWLSTRLGVGAAAVVALALVAGLSTWLGEVLTGAPTSFTGAVGGALNTVPVGLLFGGLTAVVFGLWPRWTSAVAYGAVGVAYLVQLIGALASAPSWLLQLSPFDHVAAVPAQPVDWTAAVVMLALAGAGVGVGFAGWRRRDLATA